MTQLATVDEALFDLGDFLNDVPAKQGYDGIPEWYMKKVAEIEAEDAGAKAKYQLLRDTIDKALESELSGINQKRQGLQWKWGAIFQDEVNKLLAGGKARSINTSWGRAGYRTIAARPQVVIEDEQTALAAADIACPDAITKKLKTSEILNHYKATGEVLPGTNIVETEKADKFYPHFERQIEAAVQPKLEGESNG